MSTLPIPPEEPHHTPPPWKPHVPDLSLHPLISIDPKVMVGKPCIKGTRLPVDHVVMHFAGGITMEEYCRLFPSAFPEGVLAALRFAADVVADQDFGDRWLEEGEWQEIQ